MSIDKNWTTLIDRESDEFWYGLTAFIERCKDYMNDYGRCRCPCEDCDNLNWLELPDIQRHIQEFGWCRTYTTWTWHGEPLVLPRQPVIPQTTNQLHDFLADVSQETVHTTDNTNTTDTDEPTTNDELAELLTLAGTDLYPGSKWVSSLDFLAKLSHAKAIHKWTDTSFNHLLGILRFSFPHADIPVSHYEARKTMRKVGLGYEMIDVCKNDCCIFWGEHKKKEICPTCSESRWKDKNTKGKKIPHKVMRYFPLTPRLKRVYNSRHTAPFMTWHATGQCTEAGKMRHPVDGTAWKDFDARYPDFASEPRNVRLGLAADGFNPFGNMSVSYSMWPVILTTYNTPPWLCMKESSFMLTLLIPGPKSPGRAMDVFLRPLIDELKSLWSVGVETNDATTNSSFTMRAMLLWTINDFPARSSLSGWSGQGYKACPTCNVDTPSCRVHGKTAYVGHRIWLPEGHKWRRDKLFNGMNDNRSPPERKTNAQILEQVNKLPCNIPGKHPLFGGKKRKRDPEVELNWTKRSIFFELEYWPFLQLKHNLDVMHIEKNVCESLLNTLLMHKEKSKDTNKARMVLKEWNIRPELWLRTSNGKVEKPHPQYSFSVPDRKLFCQFIKGVKLPDGFGSNFKHKVIDNDSKLAGLKSHDHHIMMQRLLPVGVRAYLDPTIATPIIELCFFFKQLCARTLMKSDMEKAQAKVIKILCSFERIFPPSFFDIMIHLVMHLPEEAIQGGPVYMRWMYPFERYMKKLKNYVRNKARPEGSIAEGYVTDEALTFCSRYLEGVETRFNRPDRNEDAPVPAREFYVFKSVCTPISKGEETQLDYTLQTKVNWFVLNNSSEIDDYKNEFTIEMPPRTNLQTEFPRWFKERIKRLRVADKSRCSDELLALANGPLHTYSYAACIVNGVRFVVHSRDLRRTTQNSGVSTIDSDGVQYYGVLEEILELCYISDCKVVLFRCKWYKTDTRGCVTKDNITSICTRSEWFNEDQYILASQANQVFYIDDPVRRRGDSGKYWKVVQEVHHRKIWDRDIAGDNEMDFIHDNTSSDISLSANLDKLTHTNLRRGEVMDTEKTSAMDDLTHTNLSRGEAMEVEQVSAMDDDDVDNTDDDTDDDVDDESEMHPNISDESD